MKIMDKNDKRLQSIKDIKASLDVFVTSIIKEFPADENMDAHGFQKIDSIVALLETELRSHYRKVHIKLLEKAMTNEGNSLKDLCNKMLTPNLPVNERQTVIQRYYSTRKPVF